MAPTYVGEIKTWTTEEIKLSAMNSAPYNPKIHTDEFLDRLEKSMMKFGDVQHLVWNKRTANLVDGHGKYKILQRNGITKAETIVVDISLAEEKALNVTLTALRGEWDKDKLADVLTDIQIAIEAPDVDLNIDLEDLGIPEVDLKDLLDIDEEPTVHVDEYFRVPPEPKNERNIKQGDIYALGEHRLMCGDTISGGDVDKLMDGKKAMISFTSPPYNVGALEIKGQKPTQKKYGGDKDQRGEADYLEFLASALSNMMQYSDEVLLNIGLVEGNKHAIIRLIYDHLPIFKDIIYWKKDTVAPHIQSGIINNKVEFILCFGDGKRKFANAQFKQGSYWNVIEGPNASGNDYADIHKATFPIYLPINIIKNFSKKHSIILDPFAGTGTTLIAAEKLGRICYLLEISPEYCNVIIDRFEAFTEQKAKKIS